MYDIYFGIDNYTMEMYITYDTAFKRKVVLFPEKIGIHTVESIQ
jgi:hypothetical protein